MKELDARERYKEYVGCYLGHYAQWFFPISGNSLEHLVGVSPEIMAYGYHRGINECYAGTFSESSQIKEKHELEEHAAFQISEAVIRHSFRGI